MFAFGFTFLVRWPPLGPGEQSPADHLHDAGLAHSGALRFVFVMSHSSHSRSLLQV